MDPEDALIPPDPDFRKVLLVRALITAALVLAAASAAALLLPVPWQLVAVPALLVTGWLVLASPRRRYRSWGYRLGEDRLRVVSGVWFRHDTVVPLGRIQHVDLEQGPVLRRWDLAELTVHTAGTHGASVSLPGLKHADATTMREAIRNHIRDGRA